MQKVITIVIPFINLGNDRVEQQEVHHPELNELLSQGYEVKTSIPHSSTGTGASHGFGSITFVLENLDE